MLKSSTDLFDWYPLMGEGALRCSLSLHQMRKKKQENGESQIHNITLVPSTLRSIVEENISCGSSNPRSIVENISCKPDESIL